MIPIFQLDWRQFCSANRTSGSEKCLKSQKLKHKRALKNFLGLARIGGWNAIFSVRNAHSIFQFQEQIKLATKKEKRQKVHAGTFFWCATGPSLAVLSVVVQSFFLQKQAGLWKATQKKSHLQDSSKLHELFSPNCKSFDCRRKAHQLQYVLQLNSIYNINSWKTVWKLTRKANKFLCFPQYILPIQQPSQMCFIAE